MFNCFASNYIFFALKKERESRAISRILSHFHSMADNAAGKAGGPANPIAIVRQPFLDLLADDYELPVVKTEPGANGADEDDEPLNLR